MNPLDLFLPVQHALYWLITALANTTLSYGVAIILFTIIVRGILGPLYVIQIKSSKKMMLLSPKIKELQKKHGKDREALSRETMALYREHNHNPALGCLLPLVQLPILWSLFLVLRQLSNDSNSIKQWVASCVHQGFSGCTQAVNSAQEIKSFLAAHPHATGLASSLPHLPHWELYQANFLWLNSLGTPDQAHILPLIAGCTQWIQQRMLLQPTSDPQQRQMNQIMQFMPLMIVVFAWQYASGLAVYWVMSNIIMMILTYFINSWGSLFTDPFSIPYATPNTAAAAEAQLAASRKPGFVSRAIAVKEAEAKTQITRRLQEKQGRHEAETDRSSADGDARATKMDRYAQRHARGAARGRPGAKGAKK